MAKRAEHGTSAIRPGHGAKQRRKQASLGEPSDKQGTGTLRLDPVIHERVRLGIVSALAVNPVLSFNDLKKLLEITDGNLSVHARKLEDAGYVKCAKSFVGRQPRTEFELTATGRHALETYLQQMEAVIEAARKR